MQASLQAKWEHGTHLVPVAARILFSLQQNAHLRPNQDTKEILKKHSWLPCSVLLDHCLQAKCQ